MAIFVFLTIIIIIIIIVISPSNRSDFSVPTKKPMSNNTLTILAFLQEQVGKKFTVRDIQRALDIEKANSIVGSLTSLANKGLVKRMSIYEDGKVRKYVQITIEGLNYNITKGE